MKDTVFCHEYMLQVKGRLIDLSKPVVMGILNLTSDSFYSGSRIADEEALLKKAEQMLLEGATILDLGACSTRPGSEPIPEDVELERLSQAVALLNQNFPEAILSADTYRSQVAAAAVQAGAGMINDISGGALDAKMARTVAGLKVPYILMHMRGTPETMASLNQYKDVVDDICLEISLKLKTLRQEGVKDIIIDPGFGFSKNPTQNFELLARLDELSFFKAPVLVGLSRKSTIWKILNITPDEALNGTTALNMVALQKGARILRVHDVKPAMETIALWENIEHYQKNYT